MYTAFWLWKYDDCDDTNTDINPTATEDTTNGDDDCDGQMDEA